MPEPLRIIHCFRSPVGGIFRHVRDLAEAHARQGHQVGIVCDSSTGGEREETLFNEIRPHLALGLVRMPIKRSIGPSDIGAFLRCYKEIKQLRPDVLHGHGAKGGALARIIGSALRVQKYRVARLYSPHGGTLHYDPTRLAGKMLFTLERAQEFLTDSLVFVCEFERRTYAMKIGAPRTRSERIYNGVSDLDFTRVDANPDAVDFLYIGMLRDLKGPDLFIDAFARAERLIGRPLSALMVGDGPQRKDYEKMMLERGLGKRIAMLPAMPPREAFAFANTVVLPSRAESMPYIVLEALAARKPVVATRVGGTAEMLGDANPALCPPGDAAALADIMLNAITDPSWADRVLPEPHAFQTTFSTSSMANTMMRLYGDLLAK